MGRKIKVSMMVLLVLLLAAGTAFAGTTRVNHNAAGNNFTAALEAMGAARNITITGSGNANVGSTNAPVSFVLGQILQSGNLLEVTLTGATFDGQAINVCARNGAGTVVGIATATPAAGTATFNFQTAFDVAATGANVIVNDWIWFSNAACAAAVANTPFKLAATSAATAPTIRIRNLTAGGIEVDGSTAVTLATIAAQYARTFAANAHTVDYLGTPGNGTNFTANTGVTNATARSDNAVTITLNGMNYNTNTGAANAGLTVGATVSLTDTVGWQGVTRVFLSNAANCAAGSDVVGMNAPSGTVALTIPAVNYNGTATTAFGLCITGNGTDALAPRTIQASTALSVSTGGVAPAPTAFSNVDVWTLNAYQAWVSWLVNAAAAPTYCLISNADTTKTVAVLLDVVSSEGATTTITNRNMGTIAPRTSNMATFTANSASLAGGTAVDLTALGANARYAPKLTVTANPSNVSMQCIQVDPVTGGRRPVNTLQNTGAMWAY